MENTRKNIELAGDALLLLDTVRARPQSIFCLNSDAKVQAEDALQSIIRNDNGAEKKRRRDSLQQHHYLVSPLKKDACNHVRKDVMTDFGVTSKDLPSYHLMTKFHLNFTLFDVFPLESLVKVEYNDVNTTEVVGNTNEIPMNVSSATDIVGVGSASIKIEDAMEQLTRAQTDTMKACRIDGSHKLEKPRGTSNSNDDSKSDSTERNSDIVIVDSHDGAEHRRTEKKEKLVSLVFLLSC